jgi:hypothetical protein
MMISIRHKHIVFALALVSWSGLTSATLASSDGATSNMDMGMAMEAPAVPAVNGFIDGEKMLFMHTEISDAGVAKILTDMMGGSPVPVVPSLANAPADMLAPVYVFTNGYVGMGPMGPLGGQPDIFVGAPGEPDYSPLRAVLLVTWNEGADVAILTSFAALEEAMDNGALSIEAAGIVVNMPFLTWPGGSR